MYATTVAERSIDTGLAARLALSGAGLMLLGAAIWGSTGTDIDVALQNGEMASYLAAAEEYRAALVANLSIWIVGVLGLGAAGTAMSAMGNGPGLHRDLARFVYWVSTSLAISAFVAWLAIIVQLSGATDAPEIAIAEVVGWYAYRADVVATALIIGVGPALLSYAGRGDWVPSWLVVWGLCAALFGVLSFLPYFVPAIPLVLTFVIVPVGIGWTLAAGIVLLRHSRTHRTPYERRSSSSLRR